MRIKIVFVALVVSAVSGGCKSSDNAGDVNSKVNKSKVLARKALARL